MPEYLVRGAIKYGDPDGNVVLLEDGEPLPGNVSEAEKQELLANGSIVPADVYKSNQEHEKKLQKLEEKRVELDAEYARLQTEEYELQDEAARKLEDAKTDTGPERGVVAPKPTQSEEQKSKAEETSQKVSEHRGPPPRADQKK